MVHVVLKNTRHPYTLRIAVRNHLAEIGDGLDTLCHTVKEKSTWHEHKAISKSDPILMILVPLERN